MPAIDMLESLKINYYSKEYFDVFNFDGSNICDNPLKSFTPFADPDTLKPLGFFGPFVFNAVIMTAPWVIDIGGSNFGWDTDNVEKCKTIIRNSFEHFSRFELHFYSDVDSEDNTNPDNSVALAAADGLFVGLDGEMNDVGIHYHGMIDVGAIETSIKTLLDEYFTYSLEN